MKLDMPDTSTEIKSGLRHFLPKNFLKSNPMITPIKIHDTKNICTISNNTNIHYATPFIFSSLFLSSHSISVTVGRLRNLCPVDNTFPVWKLSKISDAISPIKLLLFVFTI